MADITQIRMTSAEFLKLPESNLPCELINGEVFMTPAPLYTHQKIVVELIVLLKQIATDGVLVVSPADLYLDEHNVVQPDVFWIKKSGSNCQLGDDDRWHGGPDLAIEVISPSSGHHDKVDKFRLYEKHGVTEYWIIEPKELWLEVWVLDNGRYEHRGIYSTDESFTSPVLGDKTVPLTGIFVKSD